MSILKNLTTGTKMNNAQIIQIGMIFILVGFIAVSG